MHQGTERTIQKGKKMSKGKGVVTNSVKSLPMSKPMSRERFPLGSGKMSGKHGVTNGGGKHKTLKTTGGYMIGSDCSTPGHMINTPPKKL